MNDGTSVMASADVQTSTPTSQVENKSVNSQIDTTEKSVKPNMDVNDSVEANADTDSSSKEHMVPKSRMDDYRVKLEQVESRLKEAEEKARIFEALQSNPDLASAYLKNMPVQEEQDPIKAQADSVLREMGYVRKDDVQSMVQSILEQREFVKEFGSKMQELSKKYDGSDGSPRFEAEDVARYMDDYGLKDPELAYEIMNKEALADLRVKSRLNSAYTEKPGTPAKVASDTSKEELEEAAQSGNMVDYLLKKIAK